MKKTCTICHKEKPLKDFYPQKAGKNGVTGRCKACVIKNTSQLPTKMKATGCYREYIKRAGLTDYCKRTAKYW